MVSTVLSGTLNLTPGKSSVRVNPTVTTALDFYGKTRSPIGRVNERVHEAFTKALPEVARFWYKMFLRFHFMEDSIQRYRDGDIASEHGKEGDEGKEWPTNAGYAHRDPNYTEYKKRRKKHKRYLEFSGKARKQALSTGHFSDGHGEIETAYMGRGKNKGYAMGRMVYSVGNADLGYGQTEEGRFAITGARKDKENVAYGVPNAKQKRRELTMVNIQEQDELQEMLLQKVVARLNTIFS